MQGLRRRSPVRRKLPEANVASPIGWSGGATEEQQQQETMNDSAGSVPGAPDKVDSLDSLPEHAASVAAASSAADGAINIDPSEMSKVPESASSAADHAGGENNDLPISQEEEITIPSESLQNISLDKQPSLLEDSHEEEEKETTATPKKSTQMVDTTTATTTISPLLSRKAAKNTMLVATDTFLFASDPTSTSDDSSIASAAGLHDFNGLYSLQLASQLRELYRSKTLCDIKIDCSGQIFDFQKVVLSCGSGYFHKLIQDDPTMCFHELKFDPRIDPAIFEIVAESLYTGVIGTITYETSIHILKAGFYLDAKHVSAQCTEYLLHELDQDTCLEIWKAARFCANDDLLVESTAMVGRHLADVSGTDLFLTLSEDMIVDLLSSDGLEVPNEMVVYEAVLKWIKHDTLGREGLLAEVLKTVRFPYLSIKYLTDVVSKEELVVSNHDAMHMYSSAMRYKLSWWKFGNREEVVKRRDNFKHDLKGRFEKHQKEQRIKEEMARNAPPDDRTLEERIADIRDNFMQMLHEHLFFNKFILGPLVFCKDQLLIKHVVNPIKASPCIPKHSEEADEVDGEDWSNSRDALAVGADMDVAHEESFFVKYIARPIENSPCIPADSDDDMSYGEDDETPTASPQRIEESDPEQLDEMLDESVWTKYKVEVETPEPEPTNR